MTTSVEDILEEILIDKEFNESYQDLIKSNFLEELPLKIIFAGFYAAGFMNCCNPTHEVNDEC